MIDEGEKAEELIVYTVMRAEACLVERDQLALVEVRMEAADKDFFEGF